VAILLCALAYASIAQGIGWNQNAHYALVRSLADGHAEIDAYRDETGDVSWYHGHYYSTKAPGLALATTPLYFALEKTRALRLIERLPGAESADVGVLWTLGLLGVVLPAGILLLLVRRLGDLWEPGYGTAAAVTAGLGTLLLPFSTLFFDHLLAAALGFGAFAVLVLRRDLPWLAGLLAGLAICAEYPLALVAVALALYAATRGSARVAALYVLGGAAGLLPLVAYNWWAFGSPTHLSYEDAVKTGGLSGHDVLGANDEGFMGVAWPSFRTAVELLFSHIGLLTLAPVCALGVVGWVFLWRRGRRVEVVLALGLAAVFLVYNSGYVDPFGGFTPGPRFLIPILPFLAVGLAPVFRRLPFTATSLAVASILPTTAVTITAPLLAHDGRWFERITNGDFLGHGVLQVLPLCAFAAAATALAVRVTPFRPSVRELPTAIVAAGGWLALAFAAPRILDGSPPRTASALTVSALALAVTAAAVVVNRRPFTLPGGPWQRRLRAEPGGLAGPAAPAPPT
jgi:hypothetical protein